MHRGAAAGHRRLVMLCTSEALFRTRSSISPNTALHCSFQVSAVQPHTAICPVRPHFPERPRPQRRTKTGDGRPAVPRTLQTGYRRRPTFSSGTNRVKYIDLERLSLRLSCKDYSVCFGRHCQVSQPFSGKTICCSRKDRCDSIPSAARYWRHNVRVPTS